MVAGASFTRFQSGLLLLQRIRIVLFVLLCVAAANWVVGHVIVFGQILGGDAFRGKIEGEKYFLGRGNGHFTPVAQSMFRFNYWYMITSVAALFLFPTLLAGACFLDAFQHRRQWLANMQNLAARADKESLLKLVDLLDDEQELDFLMVRAREELIAIVQTRTEGLNAPFYPPYTPNAPSSIRSKQKDEWLDFIESHEQELW